MSYCLVKPLADKIKQMIKSGEIDIDKLSSMTSKERNDYFKELLGERNAKETNALFESKLLLKNQRLGLVNWAKQITGIKPEVRNTLIDRIMKMDNILNPQEEKAFLQDLASKRLGVDISIEEAKKIVELSNKIKSSEKFTNEAERISLGRAKINLTDYVNELGGKKAGLLTNIAGVPRALMSSFDLSAPLNQGWGMLGRKEWYKSVKSMLTYAKSEEGFKNLQADILTRPNYKLSQKAGLRITDLGQKLEQREEIFMTTLLDKIPFFKASQRAYTGFLNKLRMDVFDDLVSKAQLAGEDVGVGSKVVEDIAKFINNFTGGAKVGKIEGAVPALNAMFFSLRKIKSTLEILNPVNYLNPNISATARKAALRNLISSIAITGTTLKLVELSGLAEAEFDPRSSDFGKLRVGNTRIDISGGNANYATLLGRILTGESKSATTGIKTKLGEGYGETSKFDLATSFFRNKLSPNASFLVDSIVGANSIGEKKTITQSAIDRVKPMFANSLLELIKDDSTGEFKKSLFSVLGLFGAGLNVYSISEDWQQKTSKEMIKFKNRVGEEKFKQANEEYNKIIDFEINKIKKDKSYQNLSDDDKLNKISKIKDTTKKEVFKQYE